MGADLAFGRIITDEEFESEPTANEVRVQMYDVNATSGTRKESQKYAFRFGELPPYDEAKEDGYTFDGSRVHFIIHTENDVELIGALNGRNVADAFEHAFVIRAVAQTDYVPFDPSDNGGPWLKYRLAICVDNDSGVQDTFIINDDLHILHYEGAYREADSTNPAFVTDISVESLPEEWFMYLEAMAARYVYDCRFTSFGVLGISRYYDWFMNCSTIEELMSLAFAGAELRLEYNGKTTVIDDPETFEALARIFEGVEVEYDDRRDLWYTECDTSYREDAVKVTLTDKSEENRGVLTELYVSPDGTVRFPQTSLILQTYEREQRFFISFKARFSCLVQDASGVPRTYPFDEIVAFVG